MDVVETKFVQTTAQFSGKFQIGDDQLSCTCLKREVWICDPHQILPAAQA